MLNFGGEKMSKSLGNVVGIRTGGRAHDLEALRLLLHQRPLPQRRSVRRSVETTAAPSASELDDAEQRLDYFYTTLDARRRVTRPTPTAASAGAVLPEPSALPQASAEAMDDDFNTAAAVGHLYEAFVLANKLLDEPKAAPKDVRRRTLARLAGDLVSAARPWGSFSATPAEFLIARRIGMCARLEHRHRPASKATSRSAPPRGPPRTSPGPTRSGKALRETHRAMEAPPARPGAWSSLAKPRKAYPYPPEASPGSSPAKRRGRENSICPLSRLRGRGWVRRRGLAGAAGGGGRASTRERLRVAAAAVVHALAQLLANLEESQPLGADMDRLAGARVAALVLLVGADREAAEAADLDSFSPRRALRPCCRRPGR